MIQTVSKCCRKCCSGKSVISSSYSVTWYFIR